MTKLYLYLTMLAYAPLVPVLVYSMTWVWDNVLKPGYYELFGGRK